MFNLSTQDVVSSIKNTPLVNLDGILYQEYENFFGNTFKLQSLANKRFVKLESQESLPRLRLDYKDDLMKNINVFFMNTRLTSILSKKFKTQLKFSSADIWVDNHGYYLQPHTDDKRIKIALQIYLGNDNIGTSLYKNQHIVKTFDFKFNCGYALLNNEKSLHGLKSPVENDGRISLYVRYS